jgi:hypothetical protein
VELGFDVFGSGYGGSLRRRLVSSMLAVLHGGPAACARPLEGIFLFLVNLKQILNLTRV